MKVSKQAQQFVKYSLFLLSLLCFIESHAQHVNGGSQGFNNDIIIVNADESNHDAAIRLQSKKNGQHLHWMMYNKLNTGLLDFSCWAGNNVDEKAIGARIMSLNSNGLITMNPTASGGVPDWLPQNTTQGLFIKAKGGTDNAFFGMRNRNGNDGNSYNAVINWGDDVDDDLEFSNLNTELMRLKGNGRLGLGTNDPREIIEIKNDNAVVSFHTPGKATYKIGTDERIFKIAAMDNGYGGHTGSFNNNDAQVLVMNNKGNVGIGTTNPGNYRLAVEGKIGARSIQVKAGSWADFVFEENYDLQKLEEVEAFIKDNKHLPNVPSETEVMEEGLNLGEMDAILLRKIEELTLYVIEMKKRDEVLSQENAALKKRITALEQDQ